MKESILIKNGTIVTLGKKNKVLRRHALLIKKDKIDAVVSEKDSGAIDSAKTIDASGKVILPAFINAHTHFYSSFAKGLTKSLPARDFKEVLNNLWWRLDRSLTLEAVYHGALVACIDSIRHGAATCLDHHASPHAVKGSLGRIAMAVQETGLRALLCYEVSDRDGRQVADNGIEENIRFIELCKEQGRDSPVQGLFGLHASFTLSPRTLKKAVAHANALDTGFHVHTAEGLWDQKHCQENYGVRVVERLEREGVLGPQTICAHCTHIDDLEMDRLKETDTIVVHNPQSNMNNGVGLADLLQMSGKKILVGLGTDAMTANMLEELRVAVWAQRLRNSNPSVGMEECLKALLENNAVIAGRYWREQTGEIRPGYQADVILINYEPPTPLDEESFAGHLVYGISQGSVDTTISRGRILMEGGELKCVDEPAVLSAARKVCKRIWEKF